MRTITNVYTLVSDNDALLVAPALTAKGAWANIKDTFKEDDYPLNQIGYWKQKGFRAKKVEICIED